MNFDDLKYRKAELYLKTRDCFNKIKFHKDYNMCDFLIENHSISYVIDHEFIPIPSILIKLNLKSKDGILSNGYYSLYLDFEFNFLDEFLVIH